MNPLAIALTVRSWFVGKALWIALAVVVALGLLAGYQRIEIADLERAIEGWKTALSNEQKNRAEETTRLVVAAAQAASANREKEQRLNLANQKASDDYQRALQRRDADIAVLRSERSRLRSQIIAFSRAPVRSASGENPPTSLSANARAERLGDFFEEATGLQDQGADLVKTLTAQVIGLQRYIRDNGLDQQ